MEAPNDDVIDTFDTRRALQRRGHIEYKYKPSKGARSATMGDISDPFAEPLD